MQSYVLSPELRYILLAYLKIIIIIIIFILIILLIIIKIKKLLLICNIYIFLFSSVCDRIWASIKENVLIYVVAGVLGGALLGWMFAAGTFKR